MSIFIKGFSYEIGQERSSIKNVLELRESPELLNHFTEVGLKEFRISNVSPLSLAERAIKKCLKKISTSANQVESIFYAINNFYEDNFDSQKSICEHMMRLELTKAYPICLSFSFCSNYLVALNAAMQAINSGQYKNALVVTSDKLPATTSRVVQPNVSIASDAASCCYLSVEEHSLWVLKQPCLTFDMHLGIIDPSADFTEYMSGVGGGIRKTIKEVLDQEEIWIEDICRVVTNNYNKWVTPSMLELVGIKKHQMYLENISKFGHAGSSDIGINLSELFAVEEIDWPAKLLTVSTGPNMWGAAILERST